MPGAKGDSGFAGRDGEPGFDGEPGEPVSILFLKCSYRALLRFYQ